MTEERFTVANLITVLKGFNFLHKDELKSSWSSTVSDDNIPSEKLVKDSLDSKFDTSNFNSAIGSVYSAIDGKLDKQVTNSKDYNKNVVTNNQGYITVEAKPTIPSSSSDLSDGSDLVKKSSTTGLIKNDGTIDTNTYLTSHQSLTGYLQTSDIINDLTTGGTTKCLSAEQGKALNTLIGDAITYIND